MKLYQLFTLEDDFGWQPQFADQEKRIVVDEQAQTYHQYQTAHCVILRLANDTAAELERVQRALNKYGRNIKVS
jgi:hypothetical protein